MVPLRMLTTLGRALLILGLLGGTATAARAGDHSFGLGAQFWKTVDDLVDDGFDEIEEDGFAYIGSYRYEPRGLFFLGIDLEVYPDGYGGSTDSAVSPIGFVGIGKDWYAAAGVGATFSSDFDDNVSDPFFVGRVGKIFDILPGLGIDLNANYRAGAFDELENADTDAITLGATVRFSL